MHLHDLQIDAHHQWRRWNFWKGIPVVDGVLRPTPSQLAAKLALIHAEVSEAVVAVRDGDMAVRFDAATGKPEGLPIELADIVMRIADFAEALRINLTAAVATKMEFNRTVSYDDTREAV
jgi:NTP pyrophosphatase (non-canonical NTP hydrolase)